jgi:anti-sigma factor RsiW
MKPIPEQQLLGAYLDDSLDLAQGLAVERRIEQDPEWHERLQAMRRMRASIQVNAQRYAAPRELRARIQASVQPRPGFWQRLRVEGRRFARPDRSRLAQWQDAIAWRPLGLAVSIAALTVTTLNVAVWQPARDQRLMQAAVASHLQATGARPLVDIASSEGAEVQPWLAERLGFIVPVPMRPMQQATLLGARLDSLDGRPVAAVVYRLRDHVVHAFIWPASDDSATIAAASMRGLSVSHWSRSGLRYCVVSDLPPGQLVAFAESLAQADDFR